MGSLDDNLDALLAPVPAGQTTVPSSVPKPKVKHPKGFEPGHRWDGRSGYIALPPVESDPDAPSGPPEEGTWSRVMRELNLDPGEVELVGDPEVRTWDMAIGDGVVKRMWYYKARIRRRGDAEWDYARLADEVRAWKPARRKRPARGKGTPVWMVVNLADWQIGCGDGDGSAGSVQRILAVADQVEERLGELEALGHRVDGLLVAGLGDLVEGCDGWYPSQLNTIDLDQRGQMNATRRLLVRLLKHWADLFRDIVVTAVGGNHGENRQDGKAVTGPGDNMDVAVFEQVADVIAENRRLSERISWHLPTDDLVVHLDVGDTGHVAAWTHGHLSSGYQAPMNHWKWWGDQMQGGHRGLLDATVLNVGHFHHHIVYQPNDARWLVQSPPMDGGSKWFKVRKGAQSAPGTMTYVVGPDGPDRFRVLPAVQDTRAQPSILEDVA